LAIVLVPTYVEALEGRGMAYARYGNIAEAIQDLERAIELGSNKPEIDLLCKQIKTTAEEG
tara:strand:- start:771 stop:953 length:183 start_codon:yes stop_codon:yes gene_type:complete